LTRLNLVEDVVARKVAGGVLHLSILPAGYGSPA
jgi:hypothetical protein